MSIEQIAALIAVYKAAIEELEADNADISKPPVIIGNLRRKKHDIDLILAALFLLRFFGIVEWSVERIIVGYRIKLK